jgi:Uma2 family endonuclease
MVPLVTVDLDPGPEAALRPITRAEYDAMVEHGFFEGERIELLEGALVAMPPMSDRHAKAVKLLAKWFIRGLGDDLEVGPQTPIGASDLSEPEPDISITEITTARGGHPTRAHLVVEVTLSTHRIDLRIKPRIYAGAGIPDYWVIDLLNRRGIVFTDPAGDRYRSQIEVDPDAVLAFRGVEVDLAELIGPPSPDPTP